MVDFRRPGHKFIKFFCLHSHCVKCLFTFLLVKSHSFVLAMSVVTFTLCVLGGGGVVTDMSLSFIASKSFLYA